MLDLGIVRLSGSFLTGSCQTTPPDRVAIENQIRQQLVNTLNDPQITVSVLLCGEWRMMKVEGDGEWNVNDARECG